MKKKSKTTTPINDAYLAKIKKILLRHKGASKAITSKDIAIAVGLPYEDDTQTVCRKYIKATIVKYQLPVVADGNGYYMVKTPQELDKYMAVLDGRIKKIRERKKLILKYYEMSQSAKE